MVAAQKPDHRVTSGPGGRIETSETNPPPAIRLQSVAFTYEGGQRALDGIDLEIERGEFVAILGANGAGKTSLCLLLNGVIPNVIGGTLAGSIEIDGLATIEHHVYELAEHVGVVLQDPDAQILSTDVLSEVAFAAENLGVPRETMVARIGRALEIVRLTGYESSAPEELSGGQKQRLALAAGLVMEPPTFVLDEPTAQLDPIGAREVFDVLQWLNAERGSTIVIATHDSEDAARVATRVVVLEGGRIAADGPPREVFAQVELLDRVGVTVPEVVRIELGLEPDLAASSLPLDVGEAAGRIGARLASGRLRVEPPAPPRSAPGVRASPAQPLVELRGLRYRYSRTADAALDGIDFAIERGEFVALIGQNGAGKSTLIKCLAGILRPEAGEIRIEGEPVTPAVARSLPRRIGVVLQNPDTQLFRMSVLDEVRFGLVNIGLPPDEQASRIEAALEVCGLTHARDLYPFKLSFGDRRKVAVAAIVAMRPEILVFDEPTTGQDHRGRYQLCEIARGLNERGATVVMITHDMDLVARYATRSVVLGLGKVIFDGPTREAFAQPELIGQTYLAPPQAARLAQALSAHEVPGDLLSVDEVLAAIRPTPARASGRE
jgi:energy-coupling factor transport system ATP-binding protein